MVSGNKKYEFRPLGQSVLGLRRIPRKIPKQHPHGSSSPEDPEYSQVCPSGCLHSCTSGLVQVILYTWPSQHIFQLWHTVPVRVGQELLGSVLGPPGTLGILPSSFPPPLPKIKNSGPRKQITLMENQLISSQTQRKCKRTGMEWLKHLLSSYPQPRKALGDERTEKRSGDLGQANLHCLLGLSGKV